MYNITLICTTHKTIGHCNSEELLKIIEQYNPEIVFEELSIAAFNRCYNLKNLSTLETDAIKMFFLVKEIKHIPVVGDELSIDMDKKLELLVNDGDYKNLIDQILLFEKTLGFSFLNSIECEQIFEKMKELEDVIFNESNDKVLKSVNRLSNKAVDKYENEIIKNVYEYSKQNTFAKALLFIGAAHKKAMIIKLQEFNKTEDLKLNWSFYNHI